MSPTKLFCCHDMWEPSNQQADCLFWFNSACWPLDADAVCPALKHCSTAYAIRIPILCHAFQGLNLGAVGVETDRRGFVPVNDKMQVLDDKGKTVPHLYCIGDANGKLTSPCFTQSPVGGTS